MSLEDDIVAYTEQLLAQRMGITEINVYQDLKRHYDACMQYDCAVDETHKISRSYILTKWYIEDKYPQYRGKYK